VHGTKQNKAIFTMSFQDVDGLDRAFLVSLDTVESNELSSLYNHIGKEISVRSNNLGGH